MFGQPLVKTRQTHYLQVDLQNRGRAFFPGYPTCNDRYHPDREAEYGGYARHYLVRGPRTAPSHVFHEQGHAFMIPKYPGERESVVNLPHVAIWSRKFGYSLNDAFSASRAHPDDTRHTLDNTAIAWMCIDGPSWDTPSGHSMVPLTGKAARLPIVNGSACVGKGPASPDNPLARGSRRKPFARC